MEEMHSKPETLLSDEEFAALMSAEYGQQGQPVDELARQRVWQRLNVATTTPRQISRSPWYAAVALVAGLLVVPFLAIQGPGVEQLRPKGDTATAADVSLTAHVLGPGANLLPASHSVAPAQTLVFKVDLTQPAALALALSRNGETPQVRFVTDMEPGLQQPLALDSSAYGYTVEGTDRVLRFCLLAYGEREELESWIGNLEDAWNSVGPGQCVELQVR